MVYRPLPRTNGCPNCGAQPRVKARLFRGLRVECACGVAGPYVSDSDWPEHDALNAWGKIAGWSVLIRPPAPKNTKRHRAPPPDWTASKGALP